MPLTNDQRRELQKRSAHPDFGTAQLIVLAEQWNVSWPDLAKEYAQVRGTIRPMKPDRWEAAHTEGKLKAKPQTQAETSVAVAGSPADPVNTLHYTWFKRGRIPIEETPEWQATSPVANVRSSPGQIAVLPHLWQLVAARANAGLKPGEVAYSVGMRQVDYKNVEEGRLLPTADQAARICALLDLKIEETFFGAAQKPMIHQNRSIPTFSVLAVLRAKRRLSVKELQKQVFDETGVMVSAQTLSQIEKQKVGKYERSRTVEHEALARFFDLPVTVLKRTVPAALFAMASQNTMTLHQAIKQATGGVQPTFLTGDTPPLLALEEGTE